MTKRYVSVVRTHDDRLIPAAGTYIIDQAHTSVEVIGRHLMITKVRVRFADVSGRIEIAEEPEASSVEAEIMAARLNSGNEDRDTHLRSVDFFDTDRYPSIRFRSTSTRATAGLTWEVTGDLTIRAVTRPVTLQVDFEGASASTIGDERIAFSAATHIDREAFGLTWNRTLETGGVLVGSTARIELNVQAATVSSARDIP